MNKLMALCGMVMLSTASTPQDGNVVIECNVQEEATMSSTVYYDSAQMTVDTPRIVEVTKLVYREPVKQADDLNLNDIEYVEEECETDLGFDTAEYLPEGFDPHEMYVDLNSIIYMEEENTELGFDTAEYLPAGFDPYAAPEEIEDISYIEDEEGVELGFDTAEYLPADFDAYEYELDLSTVEYIEEDEFELDFAPEDYLPAGFDPLVN